MKRYIYMILLATLVFGSVGCKKFLNIVPTDSLSGNNFWKTRNDVESFTNGLYAALRSKIGNGFIPVGDMRCAPMGFNNAGYGGSLASNNLRALQNDNWTGGFNFVNMTRWKPFYDIIANANLLYKQLDEVPAGQLSEAELKRYKAEAVFVRNLCYFFLVRLYGDVPYVTKASSTEVLGRTDMVEVVKKCIADLGAVKQDLPWTYNDANLIGVRAMRGGAIALLMHLNMWAAGFDAEANKPGYYRSVRDLGVEISNTTDYGLMNYTTDDNKRLFKGRTKESLFEIYQNYNLGEKLSDYANIGYMLSHYPYRGSETYKTSRAYYTKKFLDKIYSESAPDLRKDLWFENRTANNNTFQFTKFANVYVNGVTVQNDDDLIIFRLSDAYLLSAEANAELGENTEARRFLNLVRARAGATEITASGDALKTQIFQERIRELMGEGHYYYDLVRTKKVCENDYVEVPMAVSDFNAGAWTWPIDASALVENPKMTLNNFWR